jgi:hypothetical protein
MPGRGVWAAEFRRYLNAESLRMACPGPVRAVGPGGAHSRFCTGYDFHCPIAFQENDDQA